jgi:glyoxylase-like metal-dependent hydrolase (beta-lactamase superfamily II)
MTWQVEALQYGRQLVPGAQTYYQDGWDEWRTFAFYAFLLTGPDGVALIDCGMDDPGPLNTAITANMGERGCIRHLTTGGMITDLLAARGIGLGDVDLIALTHLHADHAGNVALFPNATVALGREGWHAHLRRRESHPRMVGAPAFPAGVLTHLDDAEQGGRLALAEDEEVAPGIVARTIGGHTDDSTAFVVDSTIGSLVFPGDTIWTYDNLDRDIPVGSHVDLAACYDAMASAREAGDLVVPSHDPMVPEKLGRAA